MEDGKQYPPEAAPQRKRQDRRYAEGLRRDKRERPSRCEAGSPEHEERKLMERYCRQEAGDETRKRVSHDFLVIIRHARCNIFRS